MRHCIDVLSPFVDPKERMELIKRSEARSARILKNPLLSAKEKSNKLSIEKDIRKRLNSNKDLFLRSASDVVVRDSHSLYSILYYLSLLITMAAFYHTFENYTYSWGLSVLWIIPIVLLVVLLANIIIAIANTNETNWALIKEVLSNNKKRQRYEYE